MPASAQASVGMTWLTVVFKDIFFVLSVLLYLKKYVILQINNKNNIL